MGTQACSAARLLRLSWLCGACLPSPPLPLPCAGGEIDVRGCYCALAACEMLGLDKEAVGRACDMVPFIKRCQVRAAPTSASFPRRHVWVVLARGLEAPRQH